MNLTKEQLPWVLIDIAGIIYAIPSEFVISLYQADKITPVPATPSEIRGVINFRGSIIPLIDIRKILNLKPQIEEIEEFYELMDARKTDHMNWLNTLETSVKDRLEFTLTTDPHKCAFGKWYDTYTAKNSNLMFTIAFGRFDEPHKAIHEIAIKVREFISRNDYKGALELIEKTKDKELQQMMHLFEEIKMAFKESKREMILVLGDGEHNVAIAVDEIVAIEHLKEIDQDLINDTITKTEYILGVGKRKTDYVVLLLNGNHILKTFSKKSIDTIN